MCKGGIFKLKIDADADLVILFWLVGADLGFTVRRTQVLDTLSMFVASVKSSR